MKLHVDLYKPSGKWAYGGDVEISRRNPLYSDEFLQELVDNQDFVVDGAFEEFIVVTSHTEAWHTSTEPGFYQQLFPIGRFRDLRKTKGKS